MKKVLAFIFSLIFVFAFASCDKNEQPQDGGTTNLPEISPELEFNPDGSIKLPIIDYVPQ